MEDFIRDYFTYKTQLKPQGYMSFEHLLFVGIAFIIYISLAIILGLKNKDKTKEDKIRVLRIAGIIMVSAEVIKLIIFGIRAKDPFILISNLPLFLCSIQLIAIPVASFSKGRLQEASLDFVFIFGLLGAFLGTFFAGNL